MIFFQGGLFSFFVFSSVLCAKEVLGPVGGGREWSVSFDSVFRAVGNFFRTGILPALGPVVSTVVNLVNNVVNNGWSDRSADNMVSIAPLSFLWKFIVGRFGVSLYVLLVLTYLYSYNGGGRRSCAAPTISCPRAANPVRAAAGGIRGAATRSAGPRDATPTTIDARAARCRTRCNSSRLSFSASGGFISTMITGCKVSHRNLVATCSMGNESDGCI